MEKLTLLQLFAPLLSKLEKLEFYRETILYGEIPDDSYIMGEIEKEIFNYPPKDSVSIIENCLSKIEILRERGESIVEYVLIDVYEDRADGYVPANELQNAETKKELFSQVSFELNLFELKLIGLKETLLKNLSFDGITDTENKLEIDTKKKIPDRIRDVMDTPLDRYQTALLFHYLKDRKIVLPYSDTALGMLVSRLTGHSENTLAKHCFGAIANIKSDNPKSVNKIDSKGIANYNLNKVKTELEIILEEINNEIDRQNRVSKK